MQNLNRQRLRKTGKTAGNGKTNPRAVEKPVNPLLCKEIVKINSSNRARVWSYIPTQARANRKTKPKGKTNPPECT